MLFFSELFARLADSVILIMFYSIFMERKYAGRGFLAGMIVFTFSYSQVWALLLDKYYFASIVICDFLVTLIFYRGELLTKIATFTTFLLLNAVCDLFAIGMFMILGLEFDTVYESATYGSGAIFIVNFVLYVFVKGSQKGIYKENLFLAKSYWVLFAFIFISGLSLLLSMVHLMRSNDAHMQIYIALTLSSYILANALVVFFFFEITSHYQKYKNKFDLLEKQVKIEVAHCNEIRKMNDKMGTLKHDMKNHAICIQNLLEGGELERAKTYADDIMADIEECELRFETGNIAFDALLNYKYKEAERAEIQAKVNLAMENKVLMDEVDLCMVTANAMDNAIEACSKIPNPVDRKLDLEIEVNKYSIIINLNNSFENMPIKKGNVFQTLKSDAKKHGLGISIMKQITMQYDGTFKISHNEKNFNLIIVLKNQARHENVKKDKKRA